ncbi:MAG: hypothetical protein R3322_00150 [Kiloniellales bacterium]|nr:hypothetical protein [Kiloniellales bacterium]
MIGALIETQTITTPDPTFLFTGLNGDVDGGYVWQGRVISTAASGFGLMLDINSTVPSDPDVAGGQGSLRFSNLAGSIAVIAGADIADTNPQTGSICQFFGIFIARSGAGMRLIHVQDSRITPDATGTLPNLPLAPVRTGNIYWNDTATNVTSLRFQYRQNANAAGSTENMDTSSSMTLWKLEF